MDILQALFFCILISVTATRKKGPLWSSWSEVSPCYSQNCSDEALPSRFQFRWCLLRKNDDSICQGPHIAVTESCFDGINCPVDGQWGAWGEWKCDRNLMIAERKRECNNPPPKHGGKQCNLREGIDLIEKEGEDNRYKTICKDIKPPPPIDGNGSGDDDKWDEEDASGEKEPKIPEDNEELDPWLK